MFNGSRKAEQRCEELEKQLRGVVDRLDVLQRRCDLDWEELKDKVHRWMQRTGARERAEAKAAPQPQAAAAEQLFPGVDQASARILMQRAKMRGGRPGVRAVPQLQDSEDLASDTAAGTPLARASASDAD